MRERPVGNNESSFLNIHDSFDGSYTGGAAVKIVGKLDRDVARSALRALVQRHPLLRAHVGFHDEGKGAPYFFVDDDPERALARAVSFGEWATDDDAQNALQDAVKGFSDRDAPQWRARVLSNAAGDEHLFVVAAGHVIADALSLTYMAKHFVAACAKLLRGEQLDTTEQELLPSVEYLVDAARPPKREWDQILRIARGHLLPSEVAFSPGSPQRPRRTGLLSTVLDEERTTAVLAACRAHRAPLTGLLAASLCQAVQDVFATSGEFTVAAPVSCRALSRKVRLDDSQFGCYSRVAYVHTGAQPLWSRAARISERLDVVAKENAFSKTVRWRGQRRVMQVVSRIPRRGFTDLAVSNLGIVDFTASAVAPLKVEWIRLGANLGSAFEMFLLGACVYQKKLGLNLAFAEPHMPRDKAHATLDRLQAVLAGAGVTASP